MVKQLVSTMCAIMTLVCATSAWSLQFPKPLPGHQAIGQVQYVKVKPLQDFYAIAQQNDVGFYELVEANPGVNPDNPKVNTVVILPTRYVLPNAPHEGIIINIAEMRLYYFPKHQNHVYTFPVGVGEMNWDTPLGKMKIVQKIKSPTWFVPESIYQFRKKHGDPVPRVVKPGPDNPLGDFAMRLSNRAYLIHGTNEPAGVGQRSSAGCIRMYPKDIAALFAMVPKGTPVNIINQPYKLGRFDNELLLEAHQPFKEDKAKYPTDGSFVEAMLTAYANQQFVQWSLPLAKQAAQDQTGLPAVVGTYTD